MRQLIEAPLPTTSMKAVLEDMGEQGQSIVRKMDALRIAKYGASPASIWVPDDNYLCVSGLPGKPYNGGVPYTKTVGAFTGEACFSLLRITEVDRTASGERKVVTRLEAFRGDEETPDYSLSQKGYNGMIVTRLGRAGVARGQHIAEPTGMRPTMPNCHYGDLPPETAERVLVVRQGVADSLQIVRLILDGAPVEKVFTAFDRPIRREIQTC